MSKKNFVPNYYFYDNKSTIDKLNIIVAVLEEHCSICEKYINKDVDNCEYCECRNAIEKLKEIIKN